MRITAARILDWYDGVETFDAIDGDGRLYIAALVAIEVPNELENWFAFEITREDRDRCRIEGANMRDLALASPSADWHMFRGWGNVAPGDEFDLVKQDGGLKSMPGLLKDWGRLGFMGAPDIYDDLHAAFDAAHSEFAEAING